MDDNRGKTSQHYQSQLPLTQYVELSSIVSTSFPLKVILIKVMKSVLADSIKSYMD